MGSGVSIAWIQILALCFTVFVTLGLLYNVLRFSFSSVKWRNSTYFIVLLWELRRYIYNLLQIVFIKRLWLPPNDILLLGFVVLRVLAPLELLSPSPAKSKTLNLVNGSYLSSAQAWPIKMLSWIRGPSTPRWTRRLHHKACRTAVMFCCSGFPLLFPVDPSHMWLHLLGQSFFLIHKSEASYPWSPSLSWFAFSF